MDRNYRCDEVVPLFRDSALEDLEGLRFYYTKLSSFIDSEHRREVQELSKYEKKWPVEIMGGFWENNYPTHWEEVFELNLRSSFIVSTLSILESNLKHIIPHIGMIASATVNFEPTRPKFYTNCRSYLTDHCSFIKPDTKVWREICKINDVRNCIVHSRMQTNVSLLEEDSSKQNKIIRGLPGLQIKYGLIEIGDEFPKHTLDVIRNFFNEFYAEAERICKLAS